MPKPNKTEGARRGKKLAQSEQRQQPMQAILSYPVSTKFDQLEVVYEDGTKSLQRVVEKMHKEQQETSQQLQEFKEVTGNKRSDQVNIALKAAQNISQKNKTLTDREEEYERKLREFKLLNEIRVKDQVVCTRLSSDRISAAELKKTLIKHSRLQSLQPVKD